MQHYENSDSIHMNGRLKCAAGLATHGIALLLYAALTVLITWPLVLHLGTALPADPTERAQDVWQHFWNLWWVHQALVVEQTNPYYTHALFYPEGVSLGLHTLNLPFGLVGTLLIPLFGIVATYNLLTMLTLMLAGYCSFLLARHVVGNTPAALVAGTIVLVSPMRIDQARLALLATFNGFAVPLALLALLLALKRGSWRSIVLVAVALLLAGLSNWYHIFHFSLLFVMLATWRVVTLWRADRRSTIWHETKVCAKVGLLSGLLIAPFLLPGIIQVLALESSRKSDALMSSADVIQFLPAVSGVIWQPVPPDWFSGDFFAWLPLLLAGVGLILTPRQTRMWAAVAAGFLVLSLGPELVINGVHTGIPLPYALIRALPVVDTFRGPARLNVLTTLMLAIIAAYGLAHIFRRWSSLAAWAGAAVVIVLLVITVVRLPFPRRDATVSPFYAQLAAEPGEWGMLELPFARPDRSLRDMYTQAHHGKYIYTGHLSREVPGIPYEHAPPIAQVAAADTRPDIVTMTEAERDQLLRALRSRYLLIHSATSQPEQGIQQAAAARVALGSLSLVYTDTHLHAYRLDEVAAWLDSPDNPPVEMPLFLGLDERWPPREESSYGVGRWLPNDSAGGGLWTYTPHPRRVVLHVSLYSLPGASPLQIWLNGTHIQTLPIATGQVLRRYSTSFALPAGTSLIELHAPEGGVSPASLGLDDDTRLLSFNIHAVSLQEVRPAP